jgi:anti-sigma regulatory factor (Ser/Thr protein kinase)/uncharacterized protein (DUF1330 family)
MSITMSIKDSIIKKSLENKPFTAKQLAEVFQVSRQYIHVLLTELIHEGRLLRIGSTRSAFYVTPDFAKLNPEKIPTTFHKRYQNAHLEEHRVLLELEDRFWPLRQLNENVKSIVTFAFSEMFNNAIEHSGSQYIHVTMAFQGKKLMFAVEDAGVGVFRNIMGKRKLASETEAIQDLLKGKTTTMPRSHSGEGIFFTSRVAHEFRLSSFGHELVVNPTDTSIEKPTESKRGTRVLFFIATDTDMHLNDVFRKYTNQNNESDFGFDKTEIRVKLFTTGGVYISRSQARRILAGLEKFSIIVLDFENVPVVGQAFADEIYRVFQSAHPDIQIEDMHMSEGVRFMVERSKNEARKQKR